MSEIDFVVPWVDSSDEEWRKQKAFWEGKSEHFKSGVSDARFREWGFLKYWFRCVEKNAPWVRKVHLVTNGQLPEWINLDCDKLQWDTHETFMDKESIPAFSSRPIELQLHKIKGLAEQFVYFNDDMYLMNSIQPDFFFKDGKRADIFCERNYLKFTGTEFSITLHNDINAINKNIDNKRKIIRDNIGFSKWFSAALPLSYRLSNFANYFLSKHFVGFSPEHTASAYTKSLMEDTWSHCNDVLSSTITHKFRSASDVNQYIFRYWGAVRGDYFINTMMRGGYYTLHETKKVTEAIINGSEYPIMCINDTSGTEYTEEKAEAVRKAFEQKFPEKSSFEK